MVPPEEVENAPTTLPADFDFSEWDSEEQPAKQPASFNAFENAPAAVAAPKPPARSAAARVAVLPVAARPQPAAPRTPSASHADVEPVHHQQKSSSASAAAPKQKAESADEPKKTGMFVAIGSAAVLLVLIPLGYFKLHSKPVTLAQPVVQQVATANTPKPTPSASTTTKTQTAATAPTPADTSASDTADTSDSLQTQSQTMSKQLAAPSRIPDDLKALTGKDTAAPSSGFAGAEGMGGGSVGNVFSGENGPKVKVAAPGKVNISEGIAVGLLVQKTAPVYPSIAKTAHVSGTVVIQATISKSGSVENLHAVSGPAMLRQAALDAVKRWRFRPYLLDGQPVEVETTVNVTFALAD